MMNDEKKEDHWPYSSLMLFGYFGKDSPGGRTLYWRTWAALLLFVAGMIVSSIVDQIIIKVASATLIPTAILIIMWAYKEYLSGLDELSRMIQYEAFAFSYGVAMALALSFYTLDIHFGIYIPALWVIVAEALRGIALTRIAKKYA